MVFIKNNVLLFNPVVHSSSFFFSLMRKDSQMAWRFVRTQPSEFVHCIPTEQFKPFSYSFNSEVISI